MSAECASQSARSAALALLTDSMVTPEQRAHFAAMRAGAARPTEQGVLAIPPRDGTRGQAELLQPGLPQPGFSQQEDIQSWKNAAHAVNSVLSCARMQYSLAVNKYAAAAAAAASPPHSWLPVSSLPPSSSGPSSAGPSSSSGGGASGAPPRPGSSGVALALDPSELGSLDEAALKERYEAAKAAEKEATAPEDVSDIIEEHERKRARKQEGRGRR
mmetsp:Transcript_29812/g.98153  ORF Transcript_29812/g.98153 Transcript_29812/m.98153 type:complete len:216 (+) Transcript_29812:1884-2531(+)